MIRALHTLPLLFLAGSVSAKTFQCTDISGGPVIVVATVDEDGKSGAVSVADVRYEALYQVFGFDRIWAFKDEEEGTVYKLRIEPDGDGFTYEDSDLEGKASGSPQHMFKCLEQSNGGANENDSMSEAEINPIVRVAPVYPARALSRGIEGYVDLSFTVTTSGTVRDPVVTHSTNLLFNDAAIQAVLKWKYKSRTVEATGVNTRVEFVLEN